MRKMIMSTCGAVIFACSIFTTHPAAADVSIASWNITNLGWGDKKDFEMLGLVAANFDLLSIQEVMNDEGISRLEAELEQQTGENWDVLQSHYIGKGSYKESYAFLYRTERVEWLGGAVVYMDDRDNFAREPFSAHFRSVEGDEFVLSNVHIIYGDSIERRQDEVSALMSYKSWISASFPGIPVLLSGDFNLPPSDPAWDVMRREANPVVERGASTLSKRDGKFANLYDNIWTPRDGSVVVKSSGILDYPSMLSIGHLRARETVSDHAPVWAKLSAASDPNTAKNDQAVDSGRPSALTTFGNAQAQALLVRGNTKSMIYHLPSCPNWKDVSRGNMAEFIMAEEAEAAGFRKAKNC